MKKESQLQKLGRNIALYRHRKGLSQDALAFEAGIGERTVSRIESGETDPRFTTLEKIALTLDIELRILMEFEK
jgi:transcriptional regulator with XRE-family HTH domain